MDKCWLEQGWVIQKVNGENVQGIRELEEIVRTSKGQILEVTGVKNYESKVFNVKVK